MELPVLTPGLAMRTPAGSPLPPLPGMFTPSPMSVGSYAGAGGMTLPSAMKK